MRKEQKLVTVRHTDGQYYNFWYTPGSINSLEQHLDDGWIAIHIKDDPDMETAVVLFEKTVEE